MAHDCFGPEELDALLEDRGTPDQHAHLEDCPDCRNLLAEYRSFLAAEPAVGARPEDFAVRLPGTGPTRTPLAEDGPGFWRRLLGGPWRPAFAGACVLAVALVLILPAEREPDRGPSGMLRRAAAEAAGFTIAGIEAQAGGSWRIRWPAAEGADTYRVEVLDVSLASVGTFEAGEALEFVLEEDTLPAGEGPFFVRVAAYAGRRPLDQTPPHELGLAP